MVRTIARLNGIRRVEAVERDPRGFAVDEISWIRRPPHQRCVMPGPTSLDCSAHAHPLRFSGGDCLLARCLHLANFSPPGLDRTTNVLIRRNANTVEIVPLVVHL